jgi:hypothetical protein
VALTRRLVPLLLALLSPLLQTGCASQLTDELTGTLQATREADVRAMTGLAASAERLPVLLDRVNDLLARAGQTSDDLRASQRTMTDEVAAVASSTALAIERLAALAGSLDRAARAAGDLVEDARTDVRATAEERARLLSTVAAIGSTCESLLVRADQVSAAWETRAPALREDEARAVKALADLAEASARTGADTATVARAAARLSETVEPDVAAGAQHVGKLLGHVETLTGRLASQEVATATAGVNALLALLGGALTVVLALAVRAQFRRLVEREVAARARG